MKVEYHDSKYMVITDCDSEDDNEYELLSGLLRQGFVKALLGFHRVETENGTQYWYNITHLSPLKDIVNERKDMCLLFSRVLSDAEDILSRYPIRGKDILVSPETVFLDESGNVYFTYLPLKDGKDAIKVINTLLKGAVSADKRESAAFDATHRLAEKLAADALSRVSIGNRETIEKIAEKIYDRILTGEMIGKDVDIFDPHPYLDIAREVVDDERRHPHFCCVLAEEEVACLRDRKPLDGADEDTDPRRNVYLEVPNLIYIEMDIIYDNSGTGYPGYVICICDKDGWKFDGYAEEFLPENEAAPDMRSICFGDPGWEDRLCANMEEVLKKVMHKKGLNSKPFADGKIIKM